MGVCRCRWPKGDNESGCQNQEEAEVRAADAAAYELGLGNGRRKRMKLSVNTRDQTGSRICGLLANMVIGASLSG